MVFFRELSPQETEMYGDDSDRFLIFEPEKTPEEGDVVRRAFRARCKYRKANFFDVYEPDEAYAAMPYATRGVYLAADAVGGVIVALAEYADRTFEYDENGGAAADVSSARRRARGMAGEVALASKMFDETRNLDFSAFFLDNPAS
ncbi:MAG: hypothetical protein JWP13_850 [Candidatus Saccharibacteria bacterium]|nr:hypothetical protein [Candidatus Saccharibacteria bacterium]